MEKILRVNMTTQRVTEEPIAVGYTGLGGRGLTSKIVSEEKS